MQIPFNRPYLSGHEIKYMLDAVNRGKIAGDGYYTKACSDWFVKTYQFQKVLLTTSCTDALEMAAILLDIKPGDEVILPSFTFVSTANAFLLRGATPVFVDSEPDTPNMDVTQIESLITTKTRAIVPVHYAGVSCDMEAIMRLASKYGLFVVEDAAQAIDSFYKGRPLGSLGHLAAFSFHETKNIISGEGGMLVVNDPAFNERAEVIREKGTNRTKFFRGEVDKYGWVDIGSSFLLSDLQAAYLYAQLESITAIQARRKRIWELYHTRLSHESLAGRVRLPVLPDYATNNAHMFYIVCNSLQERSLLIEHLKSKGIMAVFHYQSLHKSEFMRRFSDPAHLPMTDLYADRLLRLPLYVELSDEEVTSICNHVVDFFTHR